MKAVLGFGEALIDLLALPPAADGGAPLFVQQAGGAPANVTVAAARLGVPSRFAGMLGRDAFSDFLLRSLVENGVDVRHVRRTADAPTALAVVALDAQGERSFSFYRPPAADLLYRTTHLDAAMFADVGCFHVCSNSLTDEGIAEATLTAMHRAAAGGALVSFDVNLRPALWADETAAAPVIWQALQRAALVKFSRSELSFVAQARLTSSEAVIGDLLTAQAQLVLVTDGAEGARWFTRTGQGEQRAFTVQACDTTAAGDAFVGALLAALCRHGLDGDRFAGACAQPELLLPVLRFAAAAGALAVTRQGAFAAMPGRDEVEALLSQQAERA